MLACHTLRKQARVEFFTAADGVEAVEAFKTHRPSITLLDINMPNLDGFGAATQIRAFLSESEEQANPPYHRIIAVTALSDDESRRRGLEECGMDECKYRATKTLSAVNCRPLSTYTDSNSLPQGVPSHCAWQSSRICSGNGKPLTTQHARRKRQKNKDFDCRG